MNRLRSCEWVGTVVDKQTSKIVLEVCSVSMANVITTVTPYTQNNIYAVTVKQRIVDTCIWNCLRELLDACKIEN